ncbi:MAG: hypothetical protein JEZ02_17230 [Desulfatibacillum sp.]|nr:hypothetical protein [Desulfatibacillum sp.]
MRNLDCPYYNTCLTSAAKHNLPDWDCGPCPNWDAMCEREEPDMVAYHILLRAIFDPEQYAMYLGSKPMHKPRQKSAANQQMASL